MRCRANAFAITDTTRADRGPDRLAGAHVRVIKQAPTDAHA